MIIAFDCDMTLVNKDNTPNHKVIDVYRWFQENGERMIVWSGGGEDYARHWAERLGLNPYKTMAKTLENASLEKIDICFDDELVTLAKVNILVLNECK